MNTLNYSNAPLHKSLNCKSEGIDLPNLEIKESKSGMFTVYPKDLKAEYILFYHKSTSFCYFVKTNDLEINSKRGIRISQLLKLSELITSNKDTIYNAIDSITLLGELI